MSLIPKPYDFEPISVGDHIRKRRLQLGLFQREAAQRLGVNTWTVLNWEKGYTEPPITSILAILEFLGCDPFPAPQSLPECLKAIRREKGWTIRMAAKAVGVDPGTWRDWESGRTILFRKHRTAISKLLNLPVEVINEEMAARWGRLHERASS